MKLLSCATALALLLAAGGCSRSDLVEATGKLTYKGQPVPSTWVTFFPDTEGKRPSQGLTDDTGHFKLTQSRYDSGVLRGKYSAFVRYRVAADEEKGRARPTDEMKDAIASHGDPKTSGLKFEVTTGGQHFEVKLDD
jgi:hypothetical protein